MIDMIQKLKENNRELYVESLELEPQDPNSKMVHTIVVFRDGKKGFVEIPRALHKNTKAYNEAFWNTLDTVIRAHYISKQYFG